MIKVIIGWGEWIETPMGDWPVEWRFGTYTVEMTKEELGKLFSGKEKNVTDVRVGDQLFHRLDQNGLVSWVEDAVMASWMTDQPTVDDWGVY